jgi:hypothetical protein
MMTTTMFPDVSTFADNVVSGRFYGLRTGGLRTGGLAKTGLAGSSPAGPE